MQIFCAILFVLLANIVAKADPPISFAPATPSFGDVLSTEGNDPVLNVQLKNSTAQPIEITRVEVGCGCLSVDWLGPVLLAPDQLAVARVTLHRKQMHAGRQSFPLTVLTGDEAIASVPIKYAYQPRIDSSSRELNLLAANGDSARANTTLKILDQNASGEVRARSIDPDLQVTVSRRPDAPMEEELVVSAVATHPFGPFQTKVNVYLGDSLTPDLIIPVAGIIEPPATIKPATILLGTQAANERATIRTVRLISSPAVHLAQVVTSSDDIEVAPSSSIASGTYSVTIRPRQGGAGLYREFLTFKFDRPIPFTIEVPIDGEVIAEKK